MELPRSSEFCVTNGSDHLNVKTDSLGRRVIPGNGQSPELDAFGDSQVLGFDTSEAHHLLRLFDVRSLNIAAAPNNGPYEALFALKRYKNRVKGDIVIGFNLSTDIFRIRPYWAPQTRSPFSMTQLQLISQSPTLMQGVLLWDSLTGNAVEPAKVMSKSSLRELMAKYMTTEEWKIDVDKYAKALQETLSLLQSSHVDVIVYEPYWRVAEELELDRVEIYRNYLNNKLRRISRVRVWTAIPANYSETLLTSDGRHWRQSELIFTPVTTD